MQDENQAASEAADASAAAVTSEQPDKPAKLKPCTKQEYKDPDTGASVTIEHDPNNGLYIETRLSGGSKTVTTHQAVPHAWAKLVKISK